MNLPLINPEYKSSISYPPIITLEIIITKSGEAESVCSYCYIEVKGTDEKLKIKVKIASAQNLETLDPKILGN